MKFLVFTSALIASFPFGCESTQKSTGRTPAMEAIVNGSFATDEAMQEERIEQGNYINEQEQRYEQ
ncbi:MAG: hypothetical protein QF718_04180 [Phycisphaerales bacterium]|jgi:hypothetical protein|nr:hypothetical protein [Phycisphaerales bacterium]